MKHNIKEFEVYHRRTKRMYYFNRIKAYKFFGFWFIFVSYTTPDNSAVFYTRTASNFCKKFSLDKDGKIKIIIKK